MLLDFFTLLAFAPFSFLSNWPYLFLNTLKAPYISQNVFYWNIKESKMVQKANETPIRLASAEVKAENWIGQFG